MTLDDYKDRYAGQTAYVIGRGPSRKHLMAAHLGDAGPVFGVNEAGLDAEAKAPVHRPVFMVQQGGVARGADKLERATLLINHRNERHFKNYQPRVAYDPCRWGEGQSTLTAEIAVLIARDMGCVGFVLLCFDALVLGNNRLNYPPRHRKQIENQMGDLPRVWVVPEKKEGMDHGKES